MYGSYLNVFSYNENSDPTGDNKCLYAFFLRKKYSADYNCRHLDPVRAPNCYMWDSVPKIWISESLTFDGLGPEIYLQALINPSWLGSWNLSFHSLLADIYQHFLYIHYRNEEGVFKVQMNILHIENYLSFILYLQLLYILFYRSNNANKLHLLIVHFIEKRSHNF